MGFHDFPYEEGIPDVPLMPRTAVTNYFIQFAKHHQLDEYTKFNTIVQKCEKDDLNIDEMGALLEDIADVDEMP